jgi:hypothetical protein
MKYLEVSERLESIAYQLKNNIRVQENFSKFADEYKAFLEEQNINSAEFSRMYLDKYKRRDFTYALIQIEQWKQNLNLHLLDNEEYFLHVKNTIEDTNIIILDILAIKDSQLKEVKMETYETGELSKKESRNFTQWLDATIGTDFELNEVDDDVYNVTIFDLTPKEVQMIQDYENKKQYKEQFEKHCLLFKFKNDDTIYRSHLMDDYLEAEDWHIKNSEKYGAENFEFRYTPDNINSKEKIESATLHPDFALFELYKDYSYFATFGTESKIQELSDINDPYKTIVMLKGADEHEARKTLFDKIGGSFCTTYPLSEIYSFDNVSIVKFDEISWKKTNVNLNIYLAGAIVNGKVDIPQYETLDDKSKREIDTFINEDFQGSVPENEKVRVFLEYRLGAYFIYNKNSNSLIEFDIPYKKELLKNVKPDNYEAQKKILDAVESMDLKSLYDKGLYLKVTEVDGSNLYIATLNDLNTHAVVESVNNIDIESTLNDINQRINPSSDNESVNIDKDSSQSKRNRRARA